MSVITEFMLKRVCDKESFSGIYGDEIKKYANLVVKSGLLKVSHGDAIYWLHQGYRNDNLLFWHKDKGIVFPYYDIDDYGSVPPCFKVGDSDGFYPEHWLDSVDHNGIIFLADEIVENIKKNLKKNGEYFTCTVDILGSPYIVNIHKDSHFDNYLECMGNHVLEI
jgi:hypothetical protein